MSFDEEKNENNAPESGNSNKKSKTFFGLEMSDGVVYTIVVILALIFIRQVVVVLQALN